MNLTVARDVPQSVVGILNKVDWNKIVGQHEKLAQQLYSSAFNGLKIPKKNGMESGISTGIKKINADVPQCILDVINEVAWSTISVEKKDDYAKQLNRVIGILRLPKHK